MPNPIEEVDVFHADPSQRFAIDLYEAIMARTPDALESISTRIATMSASARLGPEATTLAKKLVAVSRERMSSGDLPPEFWEKRYSGVLKALSTRNMTSVEVAGAVGELPAQVNVKLSSLREMGAVETVRDGILIRNGLSKAAIKALASAR